jgi:hypothetical protein
MSYQAVVQKIKQAAAEQWEELDLHPNAQKRLETLLNEVKINKD